MSTTKTQPQATTEFPPLNQIGGKALDAVSALAEANQRVVGQLIELSASAAADRLRTLNSRGTTFLIVEHNMSFVMNLCSEVIVLHRGRQIASGKPEAVRSDAAVLDAYLGA